MASARRTPTEPSIIEPTTRSLRSDMRARRAVVAAACAVAGVLFVLSYPRYGLDWLVWIALTPFIWAVTGAGWRRGFIGGCITGAILEGWGFSWVLDTMM